MGIMIRNAKMVTLVEVKEKSSDNELYRPQLVYNVIFIDIKHIMDTAFLYTFYINRLGQHDGERNDGSRSHTSFCVTRKV